MLSCSPLTAATVPLLSSPRGELPITPRSSMGEAGGGGGCDHPSWCTQTHHKPSHHHPPRLVSPVVPCVLSTTAAGRSRADRCLVQTPTEREREISDSPTPPGPPDRDGDADTSRAAPNFSKAGLKAEFEEELAWLETEIRAWVINSSSPSLCRLPRQCEALRPRGKAKGRPRARQLDTPDLSVSLMVPHKFNGTMQLYYLKSHNICWYDSFITVNLYIFVDKRGHLGRPL